MTNNAPQRHQSAVKLTRWAYLGLAVAALLCLGRLPVAADWEIDNLRVLTSLHEIQSETESQWSFSWNLDGEFRWPAGSKALSLTLDSDYSKGDRAKLDRLRTAWRWMEAGYSQGAPRWYPVYLLQTEGDHGANSLHLLNAFGFRLPYRYGFLELTAGLSKDVRTSEEWIGDIGVLLSYERKIGDRWTFRAGPEVDIGALGDVRLRGGRVRYSWDAAVDYQASERLGLGYRLWYGNTVPDSKRTQWLGITFKLK